MLCRERRCVFGVAAALLCVAACTATERANVFTVPTATGAGAGGSAAQGTGGTSGVGGSGVGGGTFTSSVGVGGGDGGGEPCGTELTGTIRDFQASHPDFESAIAVDPGIVEPILGADGKPVYAGMPTTPTTNGKEAFDQWYRDVPGINQPMAFQLNLVPSGDGDVHSYENNAFFPIDGQGFGDEGNPHNYHFTFELRTKFRYQGGEVFKFTGDDDLFTFVNSHLVIDLGGVHGAMTGEVVLDDKAAEFGMQVGGVYTLDFFFAERHTTQSNFRIDTSLSFVDCGNSDPK